MLDDTRQQTVQIETESSRTRERSRRRETERNLKSTPKLLRWDLVLRARLRPSRNQRDETEVLASSPWSESDTEQVLDGWRLRKRHRIAHVVLAVAVTRTCCTVLLIVLILTTIIVLIMMILGRDSSSLSRDLSPASQHASVRRQWCFARCPSISDNCES